MPKVLTVTTLLDYRPGELVGLGAAHPFLDYGYRRISGAEDGVVCLFKGFVGSAQAESATQVAAVALHPGTDINYYRLSFPDGPLRGLGVGQGGVGS